MSSILADNVFLTLFLVIALGADLGVVSLVATIVAIAVGAGAAVLAGELLNVSRELVVAIFAGALTNTPSLALAQSQTGSDLPAVGYSLVYPTGVVVAILLVSVVIGRKWKASKDQLNADEAILEVARIKVRRPVTTREILESGDRALVCTVRRDNRTSVMGDEGEARPGDVITVFATRSVIPKVIEAPGTRVPRRMFRDQHVGLHRFALSNRDIAGNTVGELPLFDHYGSRITRIHRVDQEILATRASGAVAGLMSQPAILRFALSRSTDQRVMTGYSTTTTVAVIFKILAVPLMLAV